MTHYPVLRYAGGKSRLAPKLAEHLPDGLSKLASPFFGGGGFEFYLAREKGIHICGYDLFLPLVNFWRQAKTRPEQLADLVEQHHRGFNKQAYFALRNGYEEIEGDLQRAAAYFAMNRASFGGQTFKGYSPGHNRFTPSSIQRLREFDAPRVFVRHRRWEEALSLHGGDFLYLDPPYKLDDPRTYGDPRVGKREQFNEGFDHEKLAHALLERKGWLLSYNDDEEMLKLYAKCRIIEIPVKYTLHMQKDERLKDRREIVILPT